MTLLKEHFKVSMESGPAVKFKAEVFLHISPVNVRKSILKSGLTLGNLQSGYGVKPTQLAIYLYHEDNVNILYDMFNVFAEFDIWEVRHLDISKAGPDEDAVGTTTAEESLNKHGTFAYYDNIPVKKLTRLGSFKRAT